MKKEEKIKIDVPDIPKKQEEKIAPIQIITPLEIPHQKPQESEIQEPKAPENEEMDINRLKQEIKAKKKLLKQKKEEAEKKRLEEEKKKEHQEEKPLNNIQEVRLIDLDYEKLKFCPFCKTKIEKSKVIQKGNILTQNLKCRNKGCDFQKNIVLKI